MSAATALRSSLLRAGSRVGATAGAQSSSMGSLSFTRGKATLPDLPYDYGALEPSISGKIMELHHKNHHQTYVNSYNDASEKYSTALQKGDISAQMSLKPLINFHGGGHLNHSLFWENLAPKSAGGGELEGGSALEKAITERWGSLDGFKSQFNTALAGVQGSGWAWLVKDAQTGDVSIQTYANQDPVVGKYKPLLGIDAWEHAYYLQYQNRKAEYFKAIWDVINWKEVTKRFEA